jgi:hypothetical protein
MMRDIERHVEEFEVWSNDGQRRRVRKIRTVYCLQDTSREKPTLRVSRTTYDGFGAGNDRWVESLGEDRFRIAGKEFKRPNL